MLGEQIKYEHERLYSREFYMLDGFFLAEDPFQPGRVAVGHHAKYDPRHFQPRLPEANCDSLC